MSQYDFGNLESPLSGTALINTHLEPWRNALHSMHSGTTRPSYAVAGMMWLDTTTTPWIVKVFDGADDISVGTVNATTNKFTPYIDAAVTATALITTLASATGGAGLNLPHGTAPSAPVNGDLWTTTAGVYARVNGATQQMQQTDAELTALASTTSAANKIPYYTGSGTATTADFVPAPTSWTPTDGSGAGLSFSSVTCRYTVVGDTVHVFLRLNYPATASGSDATINGLPFASVGENIGYVHFGGAGASATGSLYNSSSGSIKILAPNALTFRTNANLTGQPLYGYLCYRKA